MTVIDNYVMSVKIRAFGDAIYKEWLEISSLNKSLQKHLKSNKEKTQENMQRLGEFDEWAQTIISRVQQNQKAIKGFVKKYIAEPNKYCEDVFIDEFNDFLNNLDDMVKILKIIRTITSRNAKQYRLYRGEMEYSSLKTMRDKSKS